MRYGYCLRIYLYESTQARTFVRAASADSTGARRRCASDAAQHGTVVLRTGGRKRVIGAIAEHCWWCPRAPAQQAARAGRA